MKERPLIFTAKSVRGILDGTKAQTRRLVNPQPGAGVRQSPFVPSGLEDGHGREIRIPWRVGQHVWVRETWATLTGNGIRLVYRADADPPVRTDETTVECMKWNSSMFMPRWASRIDLEITDVRVERLTNITEKDARAEGLKASDAAMVFQSEGIHAKIAKELCNTARGAFACAWDKINGKRATWASNPWVWALTFRRLKP